MSGIPFPDPPLADEVVALRPWHGDDAAVVHAMACDREARRWRIFPEGFSVDDARYWISTCERDRADGKALHLAVCEAATGQVVGNTGLGILEPGLGEVWYLLLAPARGRGLAARSVALLTAWGRTGLDLRRFEAHVHPGNRSSLAVAERAGFARQGTRTMRIGGRPTRMVVLQAGDSIGVT